jgi:hypothetical protein
MLQEGQPYTDSVEMKSFKYYKFTLLDDANVGNVTFTMTPLHGDSDLYISRSEKFPNKTNNEKSSMRVG